MKAAKSCDISHRIASVRSWCDEAMVSEEEYHRVRSQMLPIGSGSYFGMACAVALLDARASELGYQIPLCEGHGRHAPCGHLDLHTAVAQQQSFPPNCS